MKNALRNLLVILGTASAIVFPASAVHADDTEIYVGGNAGASTVRPNVVFIIDTSGSMDTSVTLTNGTYDPTQTYTGGTCDSSRIYWSTNGNPPSCGTNNYFNASKNTCNDSVAALSSSGSGYYVGRLARYRTSSWWGDKWTTLSNSSHSDLVECEADDGIHGDGVNTSKLFAADGNNGGPWTSNSAKGVNWPSTGTTYTLYSANYLNWLASPGVTTYSTRLKVVQDAFANLLNSTSGINAALMRYSQNGSGGYFVEPMLELNPTNRTTLINAANAFTANGDTPLSETLYEASLYFRGKQTYFGDYSTPAKNTTAVEDPVRTENGSGSTTSPGTYKSPINYQCQKNFVVQLTDGDPTNDYQADSKIEALPGFSTITGNSSCSGDCLDELAQWMYQTDLIDPALNDKQNVITYTIGLQTDQPLLSETAKKGGGKYFTANSATDLSNAFTSILTQILAVNTTFIAPAVTVNAFNRLTHRDDLYYSLFKPAGAPDWRGNIKHYKLSGNPPIVVDANGAAAVDANTGFFSASSTSIWTLSADAPDGDEVAKGGAAGLLTTSRNMFTYTDTVPPNNVNLSTTSADHFDENNAALTKTLLGIPSATDAYRTSLIQWARGVDVLDSNEDGSTTDARRQIGDILHSKPVLMTYGGTDANPDITMFVGDNEGFLHAIDAINGTEQFAFIPKELLGILNTRYTDDPTTSHPYGMDGPISVWHNDANGNHVVLNSGGTVESGEFVYLYAGMRRGGNSYYALDVTNRSTPILKWQITGGSGDFAELGQTWSRPVVTKIKLNGVDKNVLIFGGGYDTNQDNGTTPSPDSIGRAIYIVDASTGQRLWWASSDSTANLVLSQMTNSIPSDVSVVDINNDGYADRLYVGDMGGRIWRIDFDNATNTGASNLATGGLLAELGGTVDNTAAGNRRFYYAPDVAFVQRPTGPVLTVAIGSGYRAHPLDTNIQDRFYMIEDSSVYAPPPDNNSDGIPDYPDYTESNLYDATDNILGQGTGSTLSNAQTQRNNAHGWYIKLRKSDGTFEGEKVLAESLTIQGKVFFSTFTPVVSAQSNSCAPSQGTAKTYIVDLWDATPPYDTVADGVYTKEDRAVTLVRGGIPPDPTVIFTPDGQTVVMVGTEKLNVDLNLKLEKNYWRQDQ
ncbi:MAG: pilus assembly protein PilY [Gammaproteobacteria bacterium]|nr:pilus assembly protein PilY [Gammaproteobacteria bacterium]